MTAIDGSAPFERPTFFDGQRLAATDLAAVHAFSQQARWQHNRTLHDWGIVRGLAVEARPGDRTVTVQPGYALDSEGREIVLAEARALAVPSAGPTAGGGDVRYYLTAAYAADADLPVSMTGAGVFGGRGAVRRAEAPLLRWQSASERSGEGQYRPGLDLVLATVQVRGVQIAVASSAERRHVEPVARPFIVAGQTTAGRTPWRPWIDRSGGASLLGVVTTIDTSWAGFRAQPAYLVSVVGERVTHVGGANQLRPCPIDGFSEILESGPAGFTVGVLLPRNLFGAGVTINPGEIVASDDPGRVAKVVTAELGWYVAWIGVEG
jgi:hypothetical protein